MSAAAEPSEGTLKRKARAPHCLHPLCCVVREFSGSLPTNNGEARTLTSGDGSQREEEESGSAAPPAEAPAAQKPKPDEEGRSPVPEAAPAEANAEGVRQLITDDRKRTMPLSLLNVDLTCPVCLGIIRSAMTVMECTHRFCEACITKCLRLGRKECPSCRVKCVSRRSLRRHPAPCSACGAWEPPLPRHELKL
jgi:hypothetical protein